MLVTINLSRSETLAYRGAERLRQITVAQDLAEKHGRRFAQLVSHSGEILDVVENDSSPSSTCRSWVYELRAPHRNR